MVELSSQKIPRASVDPRRPPSGLKFSQNVDLGDAARRPQAAARLPPSPAAARSRLQGIDPRRKVYYTVDVHDISLCGNEVEPIEECCVGKEVVVVVESLRPVRGQSAGSPTAEPASSSTKNFSSKSGLGRQALELAA